MRLRTVLPLVLAAGAVFYAFAYLTTTAERPVEPSPHATQQVAEDYGSLALAFEPNVGQAADDVKFLAHGAGYSIALDGRGVSLGLRAGKNDVTAIRLDLSKSTSSLEPAGELQGRTNYLLGSDPKNWHTDRSEEHTSELQSH